MNICFAGKYNFDTQSQCKFKHTYQGKAIWAWIHSDKELHTKNLVHIMYSTL